MTDGRRGRYLRRCNRCGSRKGVPQTHPWPVTVNHPRILAPWFTPPAHRGLSEASAREPPLILCHSERSEESFQPPPKPELVRGKHPCVGKVRRARNGAESVPLNSKTPFFDLNGVKLIPLSAGETGGSPCYDARQSIRRQRKEAELHRGMCWRGLRCKVGCTTIYA